MIIEQGSVSCFLGIGEAQITFKTKDLSSVDKLLKDSEKNNINADFRPMRQKRSNDANAYLWVLCDKIADVIRSTKEEVYRNAIREVGVFQDVATRHDAADDLINLWSNRGIGWFADVFDSKLDGCKRVRLYSGSHIYDTKEMSRLIDYIVEQAKDLGIETMTPDEIKQMIK